MTRPCVWSEVTVHLFFTSVLLSANAENLSKCKVRHKALSASALTHTQPVNIYVTELY